MGLLTGLTHAGQTNRVSLVLYNVERTGLQVLGHGGDFIKFPALDLGEEAAELPDLWGKRKAQRQTRTMSSGWLCLNGVRKHLSVFDFC